MGQSAVQHWKLQRLTSVGLIPLTVWFLISVASLASADYATLHQWIAAPMTTTLLILFITLGGYHAILGVQVVLEDYVGEPTFNKAFTAARLLLLTATVVGLIAILQINLESI